MNPTSEQMERASQGFMRICEEMATSNREFLDAVMRASDALRKGWDETLRSTGNVVQENLARNVSFGKTAAAARNPKELMDACSDYSREFMESCMSNGGKLSEISARATKEAIEPVAQQASNAMNKMAQKANRAA